MSLLQYEVRNMKQQKDTPQGSKEVSITCQQGQNLLERGLEYPALTPYLTGSEGARIQRLLQRYIEEIELFNPAYGLVGSATEEDIIIRHILDSLSPLAEFLTIIETILTEQKQSGKTTLICIADAGSGAGLPGIPLAICLPDVSFTLIERMHRRAGFLQNTVAILAVPNVTIEEHDLAQCRSGPFDIITFRAFHPLDKTIITTLRKLLKPTGLLAAYKGKRSKTEEELNAIAPFIGEYSIKSTPVPFLDEERHIVLIHPV
jgi:16S rRNA (guanine527-N7)-methyltransferase